MRRASRPRRSRLAAEAFKDGSPPSFTLATFDGRPVYFAGSTMIYADDEPSGAVDQAMVDRAAAWAARPQREAIHSIVKEADQWTLGDGCASCCRCTNTPGRMDRRYVDPRPPLSCRHHEQLALLGTSAPFPTGSFPGAENT